MTDGKNLEIVEKDAKIVRWIFDSYLEGRSTVWIAEELRKRNFLPLHGGKAWYSGTIQKILCNEKYIGDALCQKTYTTNTFPFIRKMNCGEADQYYAENTHPSIISREDFQKVQALINRRGERKTNGPKQYALTRKIICGRCGTVHIRRVTRSGYVAWVCLKHDRRASDCPTGRISEQGIYDAFLRMYHKLRAHAGIILSPVLKQLDCLTDTLHRDNPAMLAINEAIALLAEKNHNLSKLHTVGLVDAGALASRQAEINAKMTELRQRRRKLLNDEELDEQIDAIRQAVNTIRNGPERLTEFDESLFLTLVEKIIVESPTSIHFRLFGGLEFCETLEVR